MINYICYSKCRSWPQPKCPSTIQYWYLPNFISWDVLGLLRSMFRWVLNLCLRQKSLKSHQKFMENRKAHWNPWQFPGKRWKLVVFLPVLRWVFHKFPWEVHRHRLPWEVGDPGTRTVSDGNGTSVGSMSAAWGFCSKWITQIIGVQKREKPFVKQKVSLLFSNGIYILINYSNVSITQMYHQTCAMITKVQREKHELDHDLTRKIYENLGCHLGQTWSSRKTCKHRGYHQWTCWFHQLKWWFVARENRINPYKSCRIQTGSRYEN